MTAQHVRIFCPMCHRTLRIRTANLGRRGLCKFCGHKFRARAEAGTAGSEPHEQSRGEAGSDGANLGTRVRTLEGEFRELLTQLESQAYRHTAALQELHETRAKLREMEERERQGWGRREHRRQDPDPWDSSDSLFAWEVHTVSSREVATSAPPVDGLDSSASGEGPPIRLFEVPSSEVVFTLSGERPARLVETPDAALVAERDRLRSELESLRTELAERIATIEAEREQRRAEGERERARLADVEQRLAEVAGERDQLRHLLSAWESERGQAEQHLVAVREALACQALELQERLSVAEDALASAEARAAQEREQWEAERLGSEERHTEAQRQAERSRLEEAEHTAAERATLQRERDELRERLDDAERSRQDDAARQDQERQRWEAERRALLADAARALDEQHAQFAIERQSLQQQLDAGRGTEEEYQALRREAESLSRLLETTRQERDDALSRTEAARRSAEEADARREQAEAERARLERALADEREQRLAEREQSRAAQEAASLAAEHQAEHLRTELDRLGRERHALIEEHEHTLSELRYEGEQARGALEARHAAALDEVTRERNDLRTRLAEEEAALRAERERRGQQCETLERERDTLQERLAQSEAACLKAAQEIREVLERLKDLLASTAQERDDARRQLEEVRQERDRLAAQAEAGAGAGASAHGSGNGEPPQEAVRRLAAAVAQLSEAQAETLRQKSELSNQVRLLKAALAERERSPWLPAAVALADRPRPQEHGFDDPAAYRAELTRWLDQAQELRQTVTGQMSQLETEIHAAGDDLSNLARDLALSELEMEEDLVFGFEDSECAERS